MDDVSGTNADAEISWHVSIKSGKCFWLVGANFTEARLIRSTDQIWVVTRHQDRIPSIVPQGRREMSTQPRSQGSLLPYRQFFQASVSDWKQTFRSEASCAACVNWTRLRTIARWSRNTDCVLMFFFYLARVTVPAVRIATGWQE